MTFKTTALIAAAAAATVAAVEPTVLSGPYATERTTVSVPGLWLNESTVDVYFPTDSEPGSSRFLAFAHGAGGGLVRRFKLAGDVAAGRWLAREMADAWRVSGQSPRPLLVPVPLHRQRRRQRGFDQARWLALRLGRRLRFSVAPVGSSSMYACKSGDRRWPKPACWIFSGRRCRCSTTPLEFAAASRTNLSGSSK